MKILLSIVIVVAVMLVISTGFLWYLGVFSNYSIEEKIEGGYTVVGIEVVGPYSKVGKHIDAVDTKLKGLGIVSSRGFGIYYDNPNMVPKEKCRSFVGNILDENDFGKLEEIRGKGMKIDTIPKSIALVVQFPYKNMMSFMVGPMKVYPMLNEYVNEKGLKPTLTYEVYDMGAKKTIFVMQY